MIAAVGTDSFGPTLIQGLKNDGIKTSAIRIRENTNSGIATIIVEEKTGENRILLSKGANGTLIPEDFPNPESLGTLLPSWIILQLEIPLETVHHICTLAHSAGVNIILNPAPAVPLPQQIYPLVNTLIVNEGEAALLSGRTLEEVTKDAFDWSPIANHFITLGVTNVIVTLGSKGAFIKSAGVEALIPTEKVERVVDTTAAGDTLCVAFFTCSF
jgi:ribokinase